MPNFFGRVTSPFVGSMSPVRMRMSVVFPAPLGPLIAYRRPGKNVQLTSSNKIRGPKRIVMLLREIKAVNYIVESSPASCQLSRALIDLHVPPGSKTQDWPAVLKSKTPDLPSHRLRTETADRFRGTACTHFPETACQGMPRVPA